MNTLFLKLDYEKNKFIFKHRTRELDGKIHSKYKDDKLAIISQKKVSTPALL